MNLLALVLAGHLLGDWVVQTDWQAANKTRSWGAMAQHVCGYHLTLILLVGWWWPYRAPGNWAWFAFVGISAATHAFLDRRWPVVWLMRHTGSTPFSETGWGVLVVDQALHLSILCVLVAWLA